MDKKGKLIVFSAPSGSGKTTIVHHLLTCADLKLDFSISATSRPARGKEINEKDYYFITADTFRNHIKNEGFVEWEEVYHDNLYGTLKSEINRIWSNGKNVIFDVDVKGGLNIKKQYPTQTLAIFVQPPSIEEMEIRLRNRQTDTEEKIFERVAKAENEMVFAKDFDVILLNDDLEIAKKTAYNLVSAFLKK